MELTTDHEPASGADGSEPPATSTSHHRADIQGLRALAVVLVILFHAGVSRASGGFIGVDVFFVVSGFVITRLLVREHRSTGRVSLRSFYERRARRILPALAVLLVPVMVLSIPFGSIGGQSRTLGTGAAAALFSANVYLVSLGKGGYFHAAADVNPLLHTWSLSLEEQFYFFFPAIVALAGAFAVRRRIRRSLILALVISAICLVSFVLCVAATEGRLPSSYLADEFAFFMAPTRAWQFGIGALLAVGASRWPRQRGLAEAAGWVGLALIVWSATTYTESTLFPGTAAVAPTLGAALVLAAGIHRQPTSSRLLSAGPLGWIGDRSYSWYLWHWPLIVFVSSLWPGAGSTVLLLAALAALAPAVASYRWVEQPIRHQRGSSASTLRLAGTCVLVPLATAAALVPVSHAVSRSSAVAAFREQVGNHADYTQGCFSGRAVLPNTDCRWDAPEGAGTRSDEIGNLLVGDSNAGQFSEPFIAASNDQGTHATIQTRGVCPFVDLTVVNDHKVDRTCRAFVDDMLAEILREHPQTVVISTSADSYIERSGFELIEPDGTVSVTPDDRAAAWERGLTSIIEQLRAEDIEVVVVQPIPKFPGWDPHECATARIVLAEDTCGLTGAVRDLEEPRARAVEAQRAVVDAAGPGVLLVDPFATICPDDPCRTYRDDTWWWQDGNHVSVAGAEATTPLFADALEQARS